MKAEFEWHKCTILLYPERRDVWRKEAKFIKETIERLAETIARYEPILLGYNGNNVPKLVSSGYLKSFNIKIEYDDIWIRDTGAIPVSCDELVAFGFDAWSGLYENAERDLTVATKIGQLCGIEPKRSNLILEGGNIVSDGNGTLLTIKESILKRNSKPLEEIEKEMKEILKVKQIIWIERGLIFDETGGHIDNLCAFADRNTIMLSWTDDESNPQYEIIKETLNILGKARDLEGKPYKIIKVPIPDIFYRTKDECEGILLRKDSKNRLVNEPIQASYINFIFINGAVIVPQFDLKQDGEALEVFKKTFGPRPIIPFYAREIVLGGGGIHCATRNI